ncbi:MAG: hypothetical protein ACRC2V_21865 [Xenococcaceae cyanobacterium]
MNTLTNLNKELFTELTPTEAAVIEGSGRSSFTEYEKFDYFDQTQSFNVVSGGNITMSSKITGQSGKHFSATVVNTATGNKTNKKRVNYGQDSTGWTNMKGGNYIIEFTDERDSAFASGYVVVDYSTPDDRGLTK